MDQVEKDLKEIGILIKKKGSLFGDFLLNPSLKRIEKKNLLVSALGGSKASKLTSNLLGKVKVYANRKQNVKHECIYFDIH